MGSQITKIKCIYGGPGENDGNHNKYKTGREHSSISNTKAETGYSKKEIKDDISTEWSEQARNNDQVEKRWYDIPGSRQPLTEKKIKDLYQYDDSYNTGSEGTLYATPYETGIEIGKSKSQSQYGDSCYYSTGSINTTYATYAVDSQSNIFGNDQDKSRPNDCPRSRQPLTDKQIKDLNMYVKVYDHASSYQDYRERRQSKSQCQYGESLYFPTSSLGTTYGEIEESNTQYRESWYFPTSSVNTTYGEIEESNKDYFFERGDHGRQSKTSLPSGCYENIYENQFNGENFFERGAFGRQSKGSLLSGCYEDIYEEQIDEAHDVFDRRTTERPPRNRFPSAQSLRNVSSQYHIPHLENDANPDTIGNYNIDICVQSLLRGTKIGENRSTSIGKRRCHSQLVVSEQSKRNLQFQQRNSDTFYRMDYEDRGVCLLVTVSNVGANVREGSIEDERNIKTAFGHLGFKVVKLEEPTYTNIIHAFQQVGKHDFSQADCFVCVITSHGRSDFFFSSDEQEVHIDESIIKPVKSNRSLLGKPKLFFIQACRGTKQDLGLQVDSLPDENAFQIRRLSTHADVLISFATIPEYVAYRCPRKGSIYIQHLATELRNDGYQRNLSKILTTVHDKMSSTSNLGQHCQVPVYYSTLTKSLKFTKKRKVVQIRLVREFDNGDNDEEAVPTIAQRYEELTRPPTIERSTNQLHSRSDMHYTGRNANNVVQSQHISSTTSTHQNLAAAFQTQNITVPAHQIYAVPLQPHEYSTPRYQNNTLPIQPQDHEVPILLHHMSSSCQSAQLQNDTKPIVFLVHVPYHHYHPHSPIQSPNCLPVTNSRQNDSSTRCYDQLPQHYDRSYNHTMHNDNREQQTRQKPNPINEGTYF